MKNKLFELDEICKKLKIRIYLLFIILMIYFSIIKNINIYKK